MNVSFQYLDETDDKWKLKSYHISASYLPVLLPGSIWDSGEYVGDFDRECRIHFEKPSIIYTGAELNEHLKDKPIINWLTEKKFFYIPQEEFSLLESGYNNVEIKGLIIPLSEVARHFFLNSDNMLFELLKKPGKFLDVYNEEKSLIQTAKTDRKSIFLNTGIPIHDAPFWCRIVHDENFKRVAIKARDDYFFNGYVNKDNPDKKFENRFLESDFPIAGTIDLKSNCRWLKEGYLFLDTIISQENEWKGYEDFQYFQNKRGLIDKDTNFEDLKPTGHNHIKNGSFTDNLTINDIKGYDGAIAGPRLVIRGPLLGISIPTGTRIEMDEQEGYSTLSHENLGIIEEVTTNPDPESSGIPHASVVAGENKPDEKEDKNIDHISIGKIRLIKDELLSNHQIESDFIIVNKDPNNDHKDYISIFPYKSLENIDADLPAYKFCSKRYISVENALSDRMPSHGWGVLFRGIAILEIKIPDRIENSIKTYYLIEIEPTGDIARQFKTFLITIDNFEAITSDQFQELLVMIARGKGISDSIEKSQFEIRAQKFSPDLTAKEFTESTLKWIEAIK